MTVKHEDSFKGDFKSELCKSRKLATRGLKRGELSTPELAMRVAVLVGVLLCLRVTVF
jgi:hypothetical protein